MFQSSFYRWALESSACQQKPNEWISYLHFQVASLLSSVVNFNWKPLKFNTAPIGDFYRWDKSKRILDKSSAENVAQGQVQGSWSRCQRQSETVCQQGRPEICTQGRQKEWKWCFPILIRGLFVKLPSLLLVFGDTTVLGSSQVFSMHGASSVSDDKPSDHFLWW